MNIRERRFLLSERATLEKMLDEISLKSVIGRMSLEQRKEEVEERIAAFDGEPAREAPPPSRHASMWTGSSISAPAGTITNTPELNAALFRAVKRSSCGSDRRRASRTAAGWSRTASRTGTATSPALRAWSDSEKAPVREPTCTAYVCPSSSAMRRSRTGGAAEGGPARRGPPTGTSSGLIRAASVYLPYSGDVSSGRRPYAETALRR